MNISKNITFTLVLLLFVVLAQSAEIRGFINDEAGIISPEYTAQIEQIQQQLLDSGKAEFAIVTVNSLDGRDIESYAINIAQGKLGDNEKNNGLLLLVSVEDRKYRFEVGRGLEADITDLRSGKIGRDFLVPNFRNNEYGKGIYEASLAIQSVLGGDTESAYYVSSKPRTDMRANIFTLIFIFFILSSILGSIGRSRRYRRRDRFFDAAMMAGFMFGGRRGGLGGTGGFGGFGGGSFGGGGAGGSW